MPLNRQDILNRATPANKQAALGDVVADLIAANNALATKFNTLCAKLDTNHGAATDHVSTLGGAAQVVTLDLR